MKVQPNSAQVDELNNYIDDILWEYCLLNTANVRKQILSYLDLALIVKRELPELEHVGYLRLGITCDADLITFAKAIELRTRRVILKWHNESVINLAKEIEK